VRGVRRRPGNVAPAGCNGYIGQADSTGGFMRAETEKVVEEIKRSVGLLRRHL
jgi:hypothetical protein